MINLNKKYRLGVDLGGTTTKFIVLDQQFNVVCKMFYETGNPSSPGKALDRLSEELVNFLTEFELTVDMMSVCGIGLPGEVDPEKGLFRSSPILPDWKNIRVVKELEARLSCPFLIENDANLALLGESKLGAGKKANPLLLITIGTGIGGAIQINGELLKGYYNSAGEIGHISVDPEGAECWCGSRGCLGLMGSTTALIKKYKNLSGIPENTEINGKYIALKIAEGDPLSLQALDSMAKYLADGLSSAVKIIAPEKLILAGGIIDSIADPLISKIKESFRKSHYPKVITEVGIVSSVLGIYAGATGAALLD